MALNKWQHDCQLLNTNVIGHHQPHSQKLPRDRRAGAQRREPTSPSPSTTYLTIWSSPTPIPERKKKLTVDRVLASARLGLPSPVTLEESLGKRAIDWAGLVVGVAAVLAGELLWLVWAGLRGGAGYGWHSEAAPVLKNYF
jgi:hypothetical protein